MIKKQYNIDAQLFTHSLKKKTGKICATVTHKTRLQFCHRILRKYNFVPISQTSRSLKLKCALCQPAGKNHTLLDKNTLLRTAYSAILPVLQMEKNY